MKPNKTMKTLAVGLFTCWTFLSCNPSIKETEIPKKQETHYITQKNEEKQAQKAWDLLSKEGALTVKGYTEKHYKAIDETGVGLFYGNVSYYNSALVKHKLRLNQALIYAKLCTDQEFVAEQTKKGEDYKETALEIAKAEKPMNTSNFKLPMKTDCLEWCVFNLIKAYEKVGMKEDWLRVQTITLEKSRNNSTSKRLETTGMTGVKLAKTLAEEGWIGIYYNPDTIIPADKPARIPPKPQPEPKEDTQNYKTKLRRWKIFFQSWTEHTFSYKTAKEYRNYYGIPITDFVVDYRPTTKLSDTGTVTLGNDDYAQIEAYHVESPTVKKSDKIENLKKIPFGFLLTRGGNHTAILSYGKVYEVHECNEPYEKKLIDVKDFETEWDWLSGIIMIPPGVW